MRNETKNQCLSNTIHKNTLQPYRDKKNYCKYNIV